MAAANLLVWAIIGLIATLAAAMCTVCCVFACQKNHSARRDHYFLNLLDVVRAVFRPASASSDTHHTLTDGGEDYYYCYEQPAHHQQLHRAAMMERPATPPSASFRRNSAQAAYRLWIKSRLEKEFGEARASTKRVSAEDGDLLGGVIV